jgi:hypothetical protein
MSFNLFCINEGEANTSTKTTILKDPSSLILSPFHTPQCKRVPVASTKVASQTVAMGKFACWNAHVIGSFVECCRHLQFQAAVVGQQPWPLQKPGAQARCSRRESVRER